MERLANHSQQTVPQSEGLGSTLPTLSSFASGKVHGPPDLDHEVEERFALAQADLENIFTLVQQQASFDPWTVRKSDCKF